MRGGWSSCLIGLLRLCRVSSVCLMVVKGGRASVLVVGSRASTGYSLELRPAREIQARFEHRVSACSRAST